MIKLAGGGESRSLTTDVAVNPVLLAWPLACVLRIADNFRTVARIPAACLLCFLAGQAGFSVKWFIIFWRLRVVRGLRAPV
jgi:hypothetical protein